MSSFAITRWWLIRHAPVENPAGVIYGATDLKAVFHNRPALEFLAANLPRNPVYITSTLSRSIDTLNQVQDLRGSKQSGEDTARAVDNPIQVPELGEQNFGDWEGLRWADIRADQARQFWDDYANAIPPNGESFNQLAERAVKAFGRLNQNHVGCDIVAVLHGGTIRAILAHVLGLKPSAALSFDISPLGLTRIDYLDAPENPGWRIGGVNLQFCQD